MARQIDRIVKKLGAKFVCHVDEVGDGAFGAAQLAATLAARLQPGEGQRPGRPSDPTWTNHPKVPMSKATLQRLTALANRLSTSKRKISPMQVAAQLLEESAERFAESIATR